MSKVLIAYSKLLSIKQNLPGNLDIEEYFVRQYHDVLEGMKELVGEEVINEFKLEESEIRPVLISYKPTRGESAYSDEKYCNRNKLLTKLDAFVKYLELQSSGEERKKMIGFRTD